MSKGFFEVFPTLKLNNKLHDLMEQTQVERASSTAKRDFLRIYISSDKLIQKTQIWEVEKAIKDQLFQTVNITIKIYEKFSLSAQFTPEILTDIYKESILEELKEYNHVLFTAFKNAKISFKIPGQMILDCKESSLVRLMQEEFIRILEKIYVERCGLSVRFQVIYHEEESCIDKEQEEKVLASQVSIQNVKEKDADKKASTEAEKTPAKVTGGAKLQAKFNATTPGKKEWKGGNFGARGVKKSDNPDVVYGRDFEDEPIKIS